MNDSLSGLIVKDQSGFYWVEHADGTVYRCQLRGRLKEDAQAANIATIGDTVRFHVSENETGIEEQRGIIEAVEARHAVLSRAVRTSGKRGSGQAERQHILIANPDQALFVFSASQPTPNWKLLDRFLVTGERAEINEVVIIINKIDLIDIETIQDDLSTYEAMGYDILYTSAVDGIGIDHLRTRLANKISVLTGPSGVGKTSLLNQVQQGLGRTTNSISEFSQEGMHTTRDSALVKLDCGGYLADTPGIRQMTVWDIEPDELDAYFLDIADYAPQCKFNDCQHINEPQCAVLAAIASGNIHRRRYAHYIELREELKETYIIY